jgi:hypothetical protein
MSTGLETPRLDTQVSESMSAPPSADFYIVDSDTPAGNIWHFSDDFPRDQNGLVDLAAYDEYLPDHPDEIPPIVVEGDQTGLVHQHLYYWRRFFRQRNTPPLLRDSALKRFWEAPYNQLVMRFEEEAKVHKKFKKLVSPPPIETMHKSVADFGYLDRLGAAAVGRRIALVPEAFGGLRGNSTPHKITHDRSPLEIAEIFDHEIERILDKLESPLVTPRRVVTGAINRMGRLTNNERLITETRRRMQEDPMYYPVRIKDLRSLATLSRGLLDKRHLVLVQPLPEDTE